jgi:predicted acetylornithine/succinylornithine family transaminase
MTHCSNLYWNQPAVEAAQKLASLSSLEKVFFCNSGAEANEAALKLARKYGHLHKGLNANMIITMKQSFHGRTYGALTATGQMKYHKHFAPMMPDFAYAEFNNLESVKKLVTERTCAILVEPVQGEGGIKPAEPEFLKGLRSLCDSNDMLLIFDEVQCGMGRIGTPFAFQSYDVVPDAVSLAKGLGAGVPVGALIFGRKAADIFAPGDHATTFGGNLLAGAAASCVADHLADASFIKQINDTAAVLSSKLLELQNRHPDTIKQVRGKGLMMGIQLSSEARPLISACMERGLLLVGAGTHIIRFVPPLTVTSEDVAEAVNILDESMKALNL